MTPTEAMASAHSAPDRERLRIRMNREALPPRRRENLPPDQQRGINLYSVEANASCSNAAYEAGKPVVCRAGRPGLFSRRRRARLICWRSPAWHAEALRQGGG